MITMENPETSSVLYDKNNPFLASIKERYDLCPPSSGKHTFHCVIDTTGSDLKYEPGDSVGVYPCNDPKRVEDLIKSLGCESHLTVQLPKEDVPIELHTALLSRLSLAKPTKKLFELLLSRAEDSAAKEEGLLLLKKKMQPN